MTNRLTNVEFSIQIQNSNWKFLFFRLKIQRLIVVPSLVNLQSLPEKGLLEFYLSLSNQLAFQSKSQSQILCLLGNRL